MIPRRSGHFCLSVIACHVLVTTSAKGTLVAASPQLMDLRRELEQALGDFDEAQRIQQEQPDRGRQLFRSAAQRLAGLVAEGIVSGPLEFNLGNSYLQAGDIGRAILHYRRAERLIPRDPLLADNLAVARSRCLTTITPTRSGVVLKGVFFWHYATSLESRTKLALALYVALWIVLTLRSVLRRRVLAVFATLLALGAVALGTSVAAARWKDRNAPEGVVTGVDVAVYKGPAASYQRQFEQPLQPGMEFTLRERRGGWWKLELADGKSGWIEATQAELIPYRAPLHTLSSRPL